VSRFSFVESHREAFGVKRLCQILGISRSGFYRWRRAASARATRKAADICLAERVRKSMPTPARRTDHRGYMPSCAVKGIG
jgi:transposase-like protein